MAKRFVETTAWDDPWFRNLPANYKLFWLYLCTRCDAAGVWKVDPEAVNFFIGEKIILSKALELFNTKNGEEGKTRVAIIAPGKWFLIHFIDFQYGKLTPNCPPHRKVIEALALHKIELPFNDSQPKGCQTLQEEEEDKEEEEEKEGEPKVAEVRRVVAVAFDPMTEFPKVWKLYPRKLGFKQAQRHFKASVKTPEDLANINKALARYLKHASDKDPEFIQHGSTWFNNWRDWIDFKEKDIQKVDRVTNCFICSEDIPEAQYASHLQVHENERAGTKRAGSVSSLIAGISSKLDANQGANVR